jgi:hypothetical protein
MGAAWRNAVEAREIPHPSIGFGKNSRLGETGRGATQLRQNAACLACNGRRKVGKVLFVVTQRRY